ncbi:Protein of unknown function [Gryllus bimaculatus]|nr:Protein of unknown function [Gryllus bimaculatus]
MLTLKLHLKLEEFPKMKIWQLEVTNVFNDLLDSCNEKEKGLNLTSAVSNSRPPQIFSDEWGKKNNRRK